jgi:hypothetical protein
VLVLVLYQSAIHQLSANKLQLVKKTRFGGFFFDWFFSPGVGQLFSLCTTKDLADVTKMGIFSRYWEGGTGCKSAGNFAQLTTLFINCLKFFGFLFLFLSWHDYCFTKI